MMGIRLTAIAWSVGCAFRLSAAVYHVDAARPDDAGDGASWATAKKTIQAAVDASTTGDTVLVTNGVYNTGVRPTPNYDLNNRVLISKAITVRSVNGSAVTFIEGSGTNFFGTASAIRCVYLSNNAKLEGFTLRHGATYAYASGASLSVFVGGGVYAANTYCELRNCVIEQCTAALGGGAYNGTCYTCTLVRNRATNGGGAVCLSTLRSCLLSDNTASFAGGSYNGRNYNCTIAGNRSTSGTAGVGYGNSYNCVIWNNTRNGVADNHFLSTSGWVIESSCTTPLPSTGTGNISADPQFLMAEQGDYRLASSSPCKDAGDDTWVTTATDLLGQPRTRGLMVDMGAYETASPEPQVITFPPVPDRTYGAAPFLLAASASSGLAVTYTSATPAVVSVLSNNLARIVGAGAARILACQPGNDTYEPAAPVLGAFSVAKATLLACPQNASRVYGAANPAFGLAYAGFVYGEDAAVLDAQPTVSTTATAASPVGNYPVTASGGTDNNYGFSNVVAALEIVPAPLTVTANDQFKLYGDALAFDGTAFTATGLANADAVNTVTLSSEGAAAGAGVGSYDIVPAHAQGTGLSNYAISYARGVLRVGVPGVTLTPGDGTLFTGAVSVALSCALPDAAIRYTRDGADPDADSALYTAPLELTRTTRLRARAFHGAADPGPVCEAAFVRLYWLSVTNGAADGAADGHYPAGALLTLMADAPPPGRIFGWWSAVPASADLGESFAPSGSVTSITMPTQALALAAVYVKAAGERGGMADVRLTDGVGGPPLDVARWSADGRAWYPQGRCPLVAGHYTFRFRSEDARWLAPDSQLVRINVGESTLIEAAFRRVPVVSATAAGPGQVALSPATGQVLPGQHVTLTARPDSGAVFVRWDDGALSAARSVAPGGDTRYTAFFASLDQPGYQDDAPTVVFEGADSGCVGVTFPFARAASAPLPASFGATGLPPGLKINKTTGVISGKPGRAGTFTATLTATGPAGITGSEMRTFTVRPLPREAQGTFSGILLDASNAVQGTLALTATDKGAVSARTVTSSSAEAFSAAGWDAESNGVFTVTSRSASGEALTLALDTRLGPLSFGLTGAAAGGAFEGVALAVCGQRNAFLGTAGAADEAAANALASYRGYYTAALTAGRVFDSGEAEHVPQGSGFVAFTVSGAGAVAIAGELADGTSLSGSTTLLVDETGAAAPCAYVPLFFPLYGTRGVLAGLLAIEPGADSSPADNALTPTADPNAPVRWRYPGQAPVATKALVADRFGLELGVCGGYYSALADLTALYAGQRFVVQTPDAPSVPAHGNVEKPAQLVESALPDVPLQAHPSSGAVTLPTGASRTYDPTTGTFIYDPVNPAQAALRVNPKSGLFSGTFKLYLEFQDAKGLPRSRAVSVSHKGVLTPARRQPEETCGGQGFYLVSGMWQSAEPPAAEYRIKRSYLLEIRP